MNFLDRFRPYPELRTVIVNMKESDTVFQAVLWRRRWPFVILRNVVLLSDHTGQDSKRLTGEVLVQLRDIDFIQVL